ncbi:hypothetical protein AK830_g8195 [Neonectria ditissima]|uniref:AAA+ ATPase lid domain-containing protein n=1 Tax=Neonectria ditissima TaxID=78410 RepID=A0A0N8H699_9HYPO|nr:hypothetical protein AK830_g8195 [Neonectria ditissima]
MRFVADHWKKHPTGKGAWNGRNIRNPFIVASGLARDEAEQQSPSLQPQLRYSHFREVEKMLEDYTQMRLSVLGKDDARQALMNEERDNDYEDINETPTLHPVHQHIAPRTETTLPPNRREYVSKEFGSRQRASMGMGYTMSEYGYPSQPPTRPNHWKIDTGHTRGYPMYPNTPPDRRYSQRPQSMSPYNGEALDQRLVGVASHGKGQNAPGHGQMLPDDDQRIEDLYRYPGQGNLRQQGSHPGPGNANGDDMGLDSPNRVG